ncbi:MAG TPA: GGDEF domain-containing protein, partial [Candidatus Goldiibacteriota bacterium]|nr:GGDEF domain-containing protein [Candidatus Goldiibacteriota bacterium]
RQGIKMDEKEIKKEIEAIRKEIKALRFETEKARKIGSEVELRYEEMLKKEEAFLGEMNKEIEREITVMVLGAIKKTINKETVSLKVLRRRIRSQVRHQVSKEIAREISRILPEIKDFTKNEVKKLSLEIINQLKRQTGKQLEKEVIEQVKETTHILREQKDESERKAMIDELTGAFNRRFFEAKLEDELTLAKRFRTKMSLIMFDIDHFKNINDTYGHQTGDTVLREIGEVVRELMSSVDSLCRYGGEEFAVILPETGLEEAVETAEKIRKTVEEHAFYGGDTLINVTVSLGVAEYPSHAIMKAGIIEKADSALYAAKQAGRNNVKVALK